MNESFIKKDRNKLLLKSLTLLENLMFSLFSLFFSFVNPLFRSGVDSI